MNKLIIVAVLFAVLAIAYTSAAPSPHAVAEANPDAFAEALAEAFADPNPHPKINKAKLLKAIKLIALLKKLGIL